jgi:hypothetical protein
MLVSCLGRQVIVCAPLIILALLQDNRTGWTRYNAVGLYSGGVRFESRPGHLPLTENLRGFPQSL